MAGASASAPVWSLANFQAVLRKSDRRRRPRSDCGSDLRIWAIHLRGAKNTGSKKLARMSGYCTNRSNSPDHHEILCRSGAPEPSRNVRKYSLAPASKRLTTERSVLIQVSGNAISSARKQKKLPD